MERKLERAPGFAPASIGGDAYVVDLHLGVLAIDPGWIRVDVFLAVARGPMMALSLRVVFEDDPVAGGIDFMAPSVTVKKIAHGPALRTGRGGVPEAEAPEASGVDIANAQIWIVTGNEQLIRHPWVAVFGDEHRGFVRG